MYESSDKYCPAAPWRIFVRLTAHSRTLLGANDSPSCTNQLWLAELKDLLCINARLKLPDYVSPLISRTTS